MSANNNSDSAIAFILSILVFAIFIAGLECGEQLGMKRKEKEAVLKGHATWAVEKDGSSTFQWKEASK
jgi:hypothetical protein